ncbi:MAG: hypothetical protein WCO20_09420 [Holophagaceae bacterium]
MRLLLAVLPAAICLAQTSDLPSQLARLQRLPTDQVRSLEARLAMDPAPTDKKAYHQLHLAYVLASRLSTEDPKASKALVERTLKTFEGTKEAESQALVAGLLGLKIGFSPMSGITLSPQAMGLLDKAQAARPGNPRITLLRAIHVLHTPAFVGGGVKVALPLVEAAVRLAEAEAKPTDPWQPSWGLVESLGWLALAQVEAQQLPAAQQTVDRVFTLDPGNGFVTRMVLPRLQGKGK